MTDVAVLDREMYSEAEAARLLGLAASTLHYWLEGRTGSGKRQYRPVIRPEPKGGHPSVTWAEFVEAGLLREYRRTLKVEMAELRRFIDELRDRFGVPYPLAHEQPYASGRALMWQAQVTSDLPADLSLVAVAGDQYLLTGPSDSFLRRVEWEGDVAARWRPHLVEPNSPVLIDPRRRFGKPAVKGVSTEVLWEQREVGEHPVDIAEMFSLTPKDVRWALSYEDARRAA